MDDHRFEALLEEIRVLAGRANKGSIGAIGALCVFELNYLLPEYRTWIPRLEAMRQKELADG